MDRRYNILLYLELLKKYTDETHYIGQTELVELFLKEYGLIVDRSCVIETLKSLEKETKNHPSIFDGLVVEKYIDPTNKIKGAYHVTKRLFSYFDTKVILDALNTVQSITDDSNTDLNIKILSQLSEYEQKNDFGERIDERYEKLGRTGNREINTNINVIHEATKLNQQVSFLYFNYDLEGHLELDKNQARHFSNPYYVASKNGKYYLIGSRPGEKKICCYRLDYLGDMKIEPIVREDLKSFPEYRNKDFDINEYLNKHAYFTNGNMITGVVILEDPLAIRAVFDWFKDNAKITKDKSYLKASIKCEENSFFYWCMQYCEHITVCGPQSIVDRVSRCALNMENRRINIKETENMESIQNLYDKVVPIYINRKDYKMDEFEVNDFIHSFNMVERNKRIALGQITFKKKKYKKGMSTGSCLLLADGARRIITSLILLKEIFEYCNKNGIQKLDDGLGFKTINDIQSKYLSCPSKDFKTENIINENGELIPLYINDIFKDSSFIKKTTINLVSQYIKNMIENIENEADRRKWILATFKGLVSSLVYTISYLND